MAVVNGDISLIPTDDPQVSPCIGDDKENLMLDIFRENNMINRGEGGSYMGLRFATVCPSVHCFSSTFIHKNQKGGGNSTESATGVVSKK